VSRRRRRPKPRRGHAHRDHRFAADLHGALHRGVAIATGVVPYGNSMCRTRSPGRGSRRHGQVIPQPSSSAPSRAFVRDSRDALRPVARALAMARDGLRPVRLSSASRFRTPWITSIITGLAVAFFAAVFTVREAGSLCSIGTLLALSSCPWASSCWRAASGIEARVRAPWIWFVAPAGAVSPSSSCSGCLANVETLLVWLPWNCPLLQLRGHHSKLGAGNARQDR